MKIALFDALGSFTPPLIRHWKEQGHEVDCWKEWNPYALIGKDLCFIEWAWSHAIEATRQRLPIPVICRFHSFELFNSETYQIKFQNIDRLVFVAPHVAEIAQAKFIPSCPSVVIPNGIDPEKWRFKKRMYKTNPKVAWLGHIEHKKGVQLLLEVASQWKDAEFWLAGEVVDDRYFALLNDFADKTGLGSRMFYCNWVKEPNLWLEDKDFLLCTSPWEGHSLAIMEAMAKGIKPLIYNFPGAENLYPPECLWTNFRELRDRVSGPYKSEMYRQWIIDRGWTHEKQFAAFDEILKSPKSITTADVRKYYDSFSVILADYGDGKKKEIVNQRLKAIFNHVSACIGKEDVVADLGCGTGQTTNEISKYAVSVVGYDLSPNNVEIAKKFYLSFDQNIERVAHMDFVCADITEPDWADGRIFNTACLFDCLEHILPERRKLLLATLRPIDKVLITLPQGQRQVGGHLQIIDEEVDVSEITAALPDHFIGCDSTYDLGRWGKYRFIVLEKIRTAIPTAEEEVNA